MTDSSAGSPDWWTKPMRTEIGQWIHDMFEHPCGGIYSEDGYNNRGELMITVRNLLESVRMCEAELGPTVYDEIRTERESHAAKGYDAEHDRRHGVAHLVDWAAHYANPDSRESLVKAASLLVAAIEVIDKDQQ